MIELEVTFGNVLLLIIIMIKFIEKCLLGMTLGYEICRLLQAASLGGTGGHIFSVG